MKKIINRRKSRVKDKLSLVNENAEIIAKLQDDITELKEIIGSLLNINSTMLKMHDKTQDKIMVLNENMDCLNKIAYNLVKNNGKLNFKTL